jgi:hypothetical protein
MNDSSPPSPDPSQPAARSRRVGVFNVFDTTTSGEKTSSESVRVYDRPDQPVGGMAAGMKAGLVILFLLIALVVAYNLFL